MPLGTLLVDLADLAVVAALCWVGLRFLQQTRARPALLGLLGLAAIYLLARQLGMTLTAEILRGFFAVSVLVLVVVFQEDVRRFFDRIGTWRLGRRDDAVPASETVLARSLARLASTRTGALVVIPGREPLERHLEGGIDLRGRMSEPLLLSLFDASSPGHDGAVVLRGDRVERFAVHLPLSTDHRQLGGVGTRHAAALGLAERSDALCLVVSEERGTVSAAWEGRLRRLARPEDAAAEIRAFAGRTGGAAASGAKRPALREWRDAALAVGLAILLWVLLVPGGDRIQVEYSVPVVVDKLPEGYRLESVDPPEVRVVLMGPRRVVYLTGPAAIEVHVDALLAQLGRRTFRIDAEAVQHPDELNVVDVEPTSVKLSLVSESAGPETATGAEAAEG